MLNWLKEHVIGKMKYIFRILFLLPGFLKGIIENSIDGSRDIYNFCKFRKSNIGKNVSISPKSKLNPNTSINEGTVINDSVIKSYSYIGSHCLIQNCEIGRYCSIASNVKIGLGMHPIDNFSTSPIFYRKHNPLKVKVVSENSDFIEYKKTIIGNDVWIGSDAIIMGGVNIGTGSIIAAGAIVTKDVKPYEIVGGIPAKFIRFRFNTAQIEKLLNSNWWEMLPGDALKFKNFH